MSEKKEEIIINSITITFVVVGEKTEIQYSTPKSLKKIEAIKLLEKTLKHIRNE